MFTGRCQRLRRTTVIRYGWIMCWTRGEQSVRKRTAFATFVRDRQRERFLATTRAYYRRLHRSVHDHGVVIRGWATFRGRFRVIENAPRAGCASCARSGGKGSDESPQRAYVSEGDRGRCPVVGGRGTGMRGERRPVNIDPPFRVDSSSPSRHLSARDSLLLLLPFSPLPLSILAPSHFSLPTERPHRDTHARACTAIESVGESGGGTTTAEHYEVSMLPYQGQRLGGSKTLGKRFFFMAFPRNCIKSCQYPIVFINAILSTEQFR